jgi:hypothetical protein
MLKNVTFTGIQIIIAKTDIQIINVTIFDDCTFVGGRFLNCTLLMSHEMYDKFPAEMKKDIVVING